MEQPPRGGVAYQPVGASSQPAGGSSAAKYGKGPQPIQDQQALLDDKVRFCVDVLTTYHIQIILISRALRNL
jgi:hypothetical protein